MTSYPQKLKGFLDEIRSIDDREMRSDLLIEMADRFRSVPPAIAARPFDQAHLVPGCESQAYIWSRHDTAGLPKFYFAVENPQGISAKALAVLLDETLSGERPALIAQVSEEIVFDIFGRQIAMGRGHGLQSMVAMVKALAAPR